MEHFELYVYRYADWLATLQATPSEENLPLQLRRAGMFKRCSDRAVRLPPPSLVQAAAAGRYQGDVNSPLIPDAQARLSRASDSTQTAEAGAGSLPFFEREESVNSQSSGQAPSALQRPMPVRFGMPLSSPDQRSGAPSAKPGPDTSGSPPFCPNAFVIIYLIHDARIWFLRYFAKPLQIYSDISNCYTKLSPSLGIQHEQNRSWLEGVGRCVEPIARECKAPAKCFWRLMNFLL